MEDGKRETAVSLLPIIPEDSDTGRTYTCRVLNPAAPAGRQTSVTINVQREYPTNHFPVNTPKQACGSFSFDLNDDLNPLSHRPPSGDVIGAASDCDRGSQGSVHLLGFGQP